MTRDRCDCGRPKGVSPAKGGCPLWWNEPCQSQGLGSGSGRRPEEGHDADVTSARRLRSSVR